MHWKVFKSKRKEASFFTWLAHLRAATRTCGLRISGSLQRKAQRLSPGQLKRYSVLFLLVGVGWNGWIIVQALERPHPSIPPRPLQLAHPILPSILPPVDPSSLASLQKFRSWLDSLQADSTGQRLYNSIQRERAGLLDSLRNLEQSIILPPFK